MDNIEWAISKDRASYSRDDQSWLNFKVSLCGIIWEDQVVPWLISNYQWKRQ